MGSALDGSWPLSPDCRDILVEVTVQQSEVRALQVVSTVIARSLVFLRTNHTMCEVMPVTNCCNNPNALPQSAWQSPVSSCSRVPAATCWKR
eukprot:3848177-Amphidinium_carterae.1